MKKIFAFILATTLILPCIALAQQKHSKDFTALPPHFDNDFRFTNTLGLSGKILFSAIIDGYERILMLDLAHNHIQVIVDGPGNATAPAWSPDGSKIAFTSDRTGNKEIYISNGEGKNVERITENPATDDSPMWMPDGNSLLYAADNKNISTNIYSYEIKTRKSKPITQFKGRNIAPQISADGTLLAYSTNRYWPGWDICLFQLPGGKEGCPLSGNDNYFRPSWSHQHSFH